MKLIQARSSSSSSSATLLSTSLSTLLVSLKQISKHKIVRIAIIILSILPSRRHVLVRSFTVSPIVTLPLRLLSSTSTSTSTTSCSNFHNVKNLNNVNNNNCNNNKNNNYKRYFSLQDSTFNSESPSLTSASTSPASTRLTSTSTSTSASRSERLNKLTVVQIKELLREEGLPVSGRKADIIQRLINHHHINININTSTTSTNNSTSINTSDSQSIAMPRRSTRKRTVTGDTRNEGDTKAEVQGEVQVEVEAGAKVQVGAKGIKKDIKKDNKTKEEKKEMEPQMKPKLKKARTNNTSTNTNTKKVNTTAKANTKKTKVEPQRITERDQLRKLWNAEEAMEKKGSYTFKIMSWNVAGLRALIRKQPNALSQLASKHNLDVICLQETKLQDIHVNDPKLQLHNIVRAAMNDNDDGNNDDNDNDDDDNFEFESHYSCSVTKKGYSGTCVLIRKYKGQEKEQTEKDNDNEGSISDVAASAAAVKVKKKKQGTLDFLISKNNNKSKESTNDNNNNNNNYNLGEIDIKNLIPTNIHKAMNNKNHDSEGRIISIDYPQFTITNLYVPNSGQKLERLSYRTTQWDVDLLRHMKDIERKRNVPVIWLGDLNVAHTWRDVWNDGAKHLPKQAGVTPEERRSFQQMLDGGTSIDSSSSSSSSTDDGTGEFVDAFRHLYPDAKGHYSFWSQRAGNRIPNKGLRLDYFICSKSLMIDSNGSDNNNTDNDDHDNDNDDNTESEKKVIVRDSYMIHEQEGSDHCPIVLEIEMRK